jgi:uncharacterized protein YdhG (YjbR/CyaY superfamily)
MANLPWAGHRRGQVDRKEGLPRAHLRLQNARVSAEEIDAYLDSLEETKRATLAQLRATILAVIPEAEQGISYAMPAFKVRGNTIAGFAAFKNHLSYVPHSGSVFSELSGELSGYSTSTGALRFKIEQPLPRELVEKLIAVRLRQAFGASCTAICCCLSSRNERNSTCKPPLAILLTTVGRDDTDRGHVNYYEVLGAPEDATQEELHQAYLAKQSRLAPERFVGAPEDVLGAVKRASVVVDQAWNVLGDVAIRGNYDADLALSATNAVAVPSDAHDGWRRHHAEHVWAMERQLGLPFTSVLGIHPPAADGSESRPLEGLVKPPMTPSEEWLASPLYDPLSALERIADFFAPSGRADSHVTVPNVCGFHGSQAWWPATEADLRLSVVRLSEHPEGDGIVVDQDPPAGTRVRRRSTLTIRVVWDSVESSGGAS